MICIAFTLLVWLPALVGLGLPLIRLLRGAVGGGVGGVARCTAFAGLIGLFVASILASAIGLVAPIRPGVSIALLMAGWLSAIHHRRRWMRLPAKAWVCAVAVGLIVVVVDACGRSWYDTGLYHLQAVAWMSTGPAPRGLANLYGPLGYNCDWFPLAAVLEFPMLLGRSCFIINALTVIFAALPGVDAILRAGRGRRVRADAIIYGLTLFPLTEFGCRWGMISSLAPDLIVMVLVLFAVAVWVRSSRNGFLAVVLASFAVTIKLSAGPLLLMAVVATIVGRRLICRPQSAGLIVCLLLIAASTWLVRGIWLSGYPAYPSTVGRWAHLPWTTPVVAVQHTAQAIEFWSKYRRVAAAVRPGEPWVAGWIHRVGFSEPVVVAVITMITGLLLLGLRKIPQKGAAIRAMIACIAMLPAIGFWFSVAPDVRFGFGYLFAAASLMVAAALDGERFAMVAMPWRRAFIALVAVVLLAFSRLDNRLLRARVLRWPSIPVATLMMRHAADGTPILMPVNDDRVWSAPPPATPELNPGLRCVMDGTGRIREFVVIDR